MYHTIQPNTKIFVGGPEVSYHPQQFLKENPQVNGVIKGDGEEIVPQLLRQIVAGGHLSQVAGLVFRQGDSLIETEVASLFPMENLPFPYPEIATMEHQIFYFESSRGCPFRCSYCLSSLAGGVRFMPLEQVFAQLSIFLKHNVRQVKFVDRTFNCNKAHAMAIWEFLRDHDNGITNFHFEISAHLLDGEMLALLKTIRKEQFQLEVGVQSTNPDTIQQISRATDTEALLAICKEIDSYQTIHQHLDLIAGLPYEDIGSFERSFNTVFAIRPQQLQLGFLKILKGSQMEREVEQHEIKYCQEPPFQVLSTKWLSYDHVLLLKGVEEMVERYYNSGRFYHTLHQLLRHQPSPYLFFQEFGRYFFDKGFHLRPIGKEESHSVLKDFSEEWGIPYTPQLMDVVLFDICLKEKPKKFPQWLDYHWSDEYKGRTSQFFSNQEYLEQYLPQYTEGQSLRASRVCHLQEFHYDVTNPELPQERTFVLFDYDTPDLLGLAKWTKIPYLNRTRATAF